MRGHSCASVEKRRKDNATWFLLRFSTAKSSEGWEIQECFFQLIFIGHIKIWWTCYRRSWKSGVIKYVICLGFWRLWYCQWRWCPWGISWVGTLKAKGEQWCSLFFCLVLYFWIVIVIVIDCFCILIIEHLRTLRLSWSFDFRLNLLRPERSHPRWTRWRWASSRLKRRKRTFLRKRWEVSRLILPISSWSVPSCYLLSISSFLFFSSIYLSLKKKRAKSPRR